MSRKDTFSLRCTRCPRLAAYLADARVSHPHYHARPVAPFGDDAGRLLVVGLAPGFHGANATGRPFTGDHAGGILYETLHRHGYASAPQSLAADDGLTLNNCRITNAVKCVPPQNKPVGAEINACNGYLATEIRSLPRPAVLLALGGIAHRAVIKALGLRQKDYPFSHDAAHALGDDLTLVDSYHCSRYNTQTRRLTPPMFDAVFRRVGKLLRTAEQGPRP